MSNGMRMSNSFPRLRFQNQNSTKDQYRLCARCFPACFTWAYRLHRDQRHCGATSRNCHAWRPSAAADFTHFPYANPDAPKGGISTYAWPEAFDNLNPFIIRSLRRTARGIFDMIFGNMVFESADAAQRRRSVLALRLIAESVEMDDERTFIEFILNPAAKLSDGKPVTPEDVIFTSSSSVKRAIRPTATA